MVQTIKFFNFVLAHYLKKWFPQQCLCSPDLGLMQLICSYRKRYLYHQRNARSTSVLQKRGWHERGAGKPFRRRLRWVIFPFAFPHYVMKERTRALYLMGNSNKSFFLPGQDAAIIGKESRIRRVGSGG